MIVGDFSENLRLVLRHSRRPIGSGPQRRRQRALPVFEYNRASETIVVTIVNDHIPTASQKFVLEAISESTAADRNISDDPYGDPESRFIRACPIANTKEVTAEQRWRVISSRPASRAT